MHRIIKSYNIHKNYNMSHVHIHTFQVITHFHPRSFSSAWQAARRPNRLQLRSIGRQHLAWRKRTCQVTKWFGSLKTSKNLKLVMICFAKIKPKKSNHSCWKSLEMFIPPTSRNLRRHPPRTFGASSGRIRVCHLRQAEPSESSDQRTFAEVSPIPLGVRPDVWQQEPRDLGSKKKRMDFQSQILCFLFRAPFNFRICMFRPVVYSTGSQMNRNWLK